MKSYICQKCHRVVDYDETRPLDDVVIEHLTNCLRTTIQPAGKRITDIVPEDILKGNFVSIDDILGQEVEILDIKWADSTFKEDEQYLTLTINVEEEERKLNTGASRILEVFKHIDVADLPFYAKFEKVILPGGRRVYKVG